MAVRITDEGESEGFSVIEEIPVASDIIDILATSPDAKAG